MKQISKKLIAGLFAVSALASAPASAEVVNFDSLRGNGPLPSVYSDIAWEQGWHFLSSPFPPFNAHSSPTRIFSEAAETSFTFFQRDQIFRGAWFAGYYYVSFNLYNDGALVHSSRTLELFGNGPSRYLSAGYKGLVDMVTVVGIPGAYVMDDVTYGEVPEPGVPHLMIAGMLAAAVLNVGLRRTERRAQPRRSAPKRTMAGE